MNVANIIDFFNQLIANNNRVWFAQNKEWYKQCHDDFEHFTDEWIQQMIAIDPSLNGLTAKDCMWRIYRDTRFSADKTPYKNHFGSFIAAHGGKKSQRAGYYFHLQPDYFMFAAGIWCPDPNLLKALRWAVYDNMDELEQIMSAPSFKHYFTDFDTDYMLKKVPTGFPVGSAHDDWLKRKTFTISCMLTEKQVCSPNLMNTLMEICKAAQPLNDFLNYTFEELE